MKEKLGAALFCLLFAVVFGGGGAFATWVIAGTIVDGLRARDWVLVKADVDSFNEGQVGYRYSFKGREFTGDRLGTSVVGGNDNIDEWHEEMAERIAAARNERRPITVFVNPENPSESMVDRRIRWSFLVFLLPFSLGFGGVGVGALWFLARMLSGKDGGEKSRGKRAVSRDSDARTGIWVLWAFAFFWNVISFPIAILAIPPIVQSEEWIGLAVLLFPLVGIGLLWGAISATIAHLRRGRAGIASPASTPRAGSTLLQETEPSREIKAGIGLRDGETVPAAMGPELERLERLMGQLGVKHLTPDQRAAFAKLTPDQRALVAKVTDWGPALKKAVIGIVCFLIALEFLPSIVASLLNR